MTPRLTALVESSDGSTGEAEFDIPVASGPGWNGVIDPPALPTLPVTSQTVDVPDAFDKTGATDLTALFQAFLDSVPDGSEVVYPDGAVYWVENTLLLPNRSNLVLRSTGKTTILQKTNGTGLGLSDRDLRVRSFWRIRGCSRLRFEGLYHKGANALGGLDTNAYVPMLEAQHIFDVSGLCEDVELAYVGGDHIFGDFVYVGGNSWRVHAHHFDFSNNGRQGFAVTAGGDVLIEDGTMLENRRAIVDLEPNSSKNRIERVTVRRNHFGRHRLLNLACAGHPGYVGHVEFSDNFYDGAPAGGKVSAKVRRGPFAFLRNVATGSSGNPQGWSMSFAHVDGIRVIGNRQPVQRDRDMHMAGISTDCTDVVVEDNDISPNGVGQIKYFEAEPIPEVVP